MRMQAVNCRIKVERQPQMQTIANASSALAVMQAPPLQSGMRVYEIAVHPSSTPTALSP